MIDDNYRSHKSVLYNEVINLLTKFPIEKELTVVDGTFGGGGHSFGLFNNPNKKIMFAFDQDQEAFSNGCKLIKEKSIDPEKFKFINDNFINFDQYLKDYKGKIDFFLMDIGVSSHHFDKGERGFSFKFDANLDMRMDIQNNKITAEEIINEYDEKELIEIFYKYGEEKYSNRIARSICENRKLKKISTTFELAEIIKNCYPKKEIAISKINPATKVFQALRIVVNKELEVLEEVIPKIFDYLSQDGMLAIITFHSLEDRIVKHCFKKIFNESKENCTILTKKPILPTQEEIDNNKRSRSAKLRVLVKAMEELSEKEKKYAKFKKQHNFKYFEI